VERHRAGERDGLPPAAKRQRVLPSGSGRDQAFLEDSERSPLLVTRPPRARSRSRTPPRPAGSTSGTAPLQSKQGTTSHPIANQSPRRVWFLPSRNSLHRNPSIILPPHGPPSPPSPSTYPCPSSPIPDIPSHSLSVNNRLPILLPRRCPS